ncbi:DUF2946 domain-containing protein, partial [Pseudomonas sp. TNT11]
MKIARADRSFIAWMLYCCVLFNVFACSIGHGQMVGMQLNGIGGQFCTVDPRTQAPKPSNSTDESLPTLSKAFGCPLCSTGGMGIDGDARPVADAVPGRSVRRRSIEPDARAGAVGGQVRLGIGQ